MTIDREKVLTDESYKSEMRRLLQTDILALARVLGYTLILDHVHGPVADLCVKKDPGVEIADLDPKKEFLHLDPRGTFKSTVSIVDSIQWIICYPNVRICKLTATKALAAAIAGEIADHFVLPSNGEPTDFQLLFPEFCIPKKLTGEYTAPCRTRNWREATVMSFSIETSISGWHFDVFDPDDVVDTQNSGTPASVEKVKKNYRINKKTLMPWGYVNLKGTRYNPFDLYGDIIAKAQSASTKTLVRSALKMKNGKRLEEGTFPARDEMDLLFPELHSYEFLKKEFEDDYQSFMSQFMNDAHGGKEVLFTPEMIMRATIAQEDVPYMGEIVCNWRFAYRGKDAMKYNGGAVGIASNGRLFITDVVRGTFTPTSLAHRIVQLAQQHGINRVSVEETPGAHYMESVILNYAASLNWPISINWTPYEDDDAARDLRLRQLEPLINATRVQFSDGISILPELQRQFANYGMIDDNEIIDVISRLSNVLPKSILAVHQTADQALAWERLQSSGLYDKAYGMGRYAEPDILPTYQAPVNDYGLDDVLGGLNG